ncbi:MAG: tRNA (adenosine(37)-N6)-dimethylallyltransferase MiaA [Saprospiraceae bacterium]
MKKLIVIGGATATGKTALAIQLAQHFATEIISADSRQFYREMNIGTAKPNKDELAAVTHHFIDSHSVVDDYSVGEYEPAALEVLENIFLEQEFAILVGGSGLYLRAVCEGLDNFPDISESTKKIVETGEKKSGLAWLQAELAKRDPSHFAKMDQQNPARLRRALEVCIETGQPYSTYLNQGQKQPRPFQPVYILLDMPRPDLYARIEDRVDSMIVAGLEQEVRELMPYRNRPPLNTVGYEEFFEFFDGKISREEAIVKIKQHSRNYAKRQKTWFAKHGNWNVFPAEEPQTVLAYLKTLS